jgi:PAS domain S-box-containing protein
MDGHVTGPDDLARLAACVPGFLYTYKQTAEDHRSFPYASEGIRDIFGVAPEEAERDASKILDNIHPDDLSYLLESIHESRRTLTTWTAEFRVNHPTAGRLWVQGRSNPQCLDGGATLWHGFIHDITARKQAEQERAAYRDQLEEAHRRFELARDSTGMGVFDYRPRNDELIWDRGMFPLYGVDPKDFGG